MYYILFYKTVDHYIEKRAPFREEHLALVRTSHARGELVMGGALSDPAEEAVIVFRGDSPAVAENFVQNDPYVRNNLIKEWKSRPWTVVIGG